MKVLHYSDLGTCGAEEPGSWADSWAGTDVGAA